MVSWVPFLSYLGLCVAAALLGWLPFRIIEHFSLVERVEETRQTMDRHADRPGRHCVGCGTHNEDAYGFCRECGKRLPRTG